MDTTTQPGRAVLSERLATLDLGAVDAAELAGRVAHEVLRLLGAERAVVWSWRPALRGFLVDQSGEEVRAVEAAVEDAAELFAAPAVWPSSSSGIRRELVEASFGIASEEAGGVTVAIPLRAPGGPVGLLLVGVHGSVQAHALLERGAALAAQAAALLANHEALLRARRHEAQLEALYQTAGELSSKLDLQVVLRAIAERAQHLVRAPIAYIMMVDDAEREIYMRLAVGTTHPSFDEIRLELGKGLGGRVAQEEHPFYTSDYLNDSRFLHRPEVDEEVRKEGIKSILGVPMKAFERFIGVLYTADRRVRSFTDADVEVLTSLAHHATLAIDNSALYQKATRALAELETANQVVQAQYERLHRGEQMHRQLSEVVLAGQGLPGVLDLMARLLDGHVVALDPHGRVLSTAGAPGDAFGDRLAAQGLAAGLLDDSQVLEASRQLDSFHTSVVTPRPPMRMFPRLVVAVVARAEVLGSVWVETRNERAADERPLVQQAARVVALELLKERSVAAVEHRLQRELLSELLSERAARGTALQRQALDLGVDLAVPHRLALVAVRERAGGETERSAGLGPAGRELLEALRTRAWCAFASEAAGQVVALLDTAEPACRQRLERLLAERRRTGVTLRAVLTSPCAQVAEYQPGYLACRQILELFSGSDGPIVLDLDECRVLTLLFREGGEAQLRRFVEATLGHVLEYDRRQGGRLIATLEAYLAAGCSPTRAAAALHLHVNTLYYRLERLRRLLGDDFASPRRQLDLQVALLARRNLTNSAS
ncbi:MAG TPA: helix-turn-helix domain-containing protein [Actinomycetes bacterium]|jgi:sugar diacid utilization regulator|nr:helix-turn-helix domain-containing protein [Actinomycetes bacterium]